MTVMRICRSSFAGAALLACPAVAGPPYMTDDAIPTEAGKWEIFSFVEGTHRRKEGEAEAGLDINYGLAEDLQVVTTIPFEYEHDSRTRTGFGDIEVGIKYRFLHQREGTLIPDISFYPVATLPSGGKFGTGRVALSLPLWFSKDLGEWSMFGGGGYTINPGAGNKDYVTLGYAVTRRLNERISIGAEVAREGGSAVGEGAVTHIGGGVTYRIAEQWALLASAGPDFGRGVGRGGYSFYLGLVFAN